MHRMVKTQASNSEPQLYNCKRMNSGLRCVPFGVATTHYSVGRCSRWTSNLVSISSHVRCCGLCFFVCGLCVASVRPCVRASVHPCIMHPCIRASVHPCIHASMHPHMHACTHASVHPCIHASVHPCIRTSVHPCVARTCRTGVSMPGSAVADLCL